MKRTTNMLEIKIKDKSVKKPVKKTKHRIFKGIFNWIILVLVAIVTGYAFVMFGFQTINVVGPSMNDTLKDGQVVVVNKLSYKFGSVERYDIVAFSLVENDDYYDIKRVIGMPGETVSIADGVLYIDGQPLGTSVVSGSILTEGIAKKGVTLGDNEYFLLGDNVNNSEDSRYTNIGNVSSAEILGKVIYTWSPKESRGKIK